MCFVGGGGLIAPLASPTSHWGGATSLWGGPTSLWGSHVPSCPSGPRGVPCLLLFLRCFMGGPTFLWGGPTSLWGGSHVPLGVPCPLLSLWSLWGVPHPIGGGPISLWGVLCPLLSLRSLLGGSYVPFRVLCPLPYLRSLWGGPMSLLGSCVPSHPLGPFGVSHIPLGEVPCPFGSPVSPPVPLVPFGAGSTSLF